MKYKFELYNEKTHVIQGYLEYDSETQIFGITVSYEPDIKLVDPFFSIMRGRNIVEVPTNIVNTWVEGRVFPPNRQFLHLILEQLDMVEYDIFEMLYKNEGYSHMDNTVLRDIEGQPIPKFKSRKDMHK